MHEGLRRRELLQRSAAASGAVASLWAVPRLVREAYGDPIPIPPAARSVEGGLAAFAARWQGAGPVVRVTRFGPYLSDKVFNCRVAGTERAYVLRLGTAGGELTPGIDPFRHADMVMAEQDWLGLLYGDFTGLGPLIEGGVFPARDGANKVALLGIVMYLFAHIPAGADPDPDLLLHVLEGVAQRGVARRRSERAPAQHRRLGPISEAAHRARELPPRWHPRAGVDRADDALQLLLGLRDAAGTSERP